MAIPGDWRGELGDDPASGPAPRSRVKDTPWYRCLEGLARSPLTPVLVVGPGALGAARKLHRMTHPRSRLPFVHVDCRWMPQRDVARLLFGSESATKVERGFFERASGGTLFLDAVEELPAGEQGRVSELLGSMRFRREHGEREVEVSFRVVAGLASSEAQAMGRLLRELHARLSAAVLR